MIDKKYVLAAELRALKAIASNIVLLDQNKFYEGMFVHESPKAIFKALENIHKGGIKLDSLSLFQHSNEISYEVSKELTDSILHGVIPSDSVSSSVDDIVTVLNKAKVNQELIDRSEELLSMVKSDDHSELSSCLLKIEDTVIHGTKVSNMRDLDEWTDDFIEDLELRKLRTRYPFGDEQLDKLIFKGAYPGAITTLAGATGMGKSAYSLGLVNSRINLSLPTIYCSLEMSDIDTYDRLFSMRTEIPMNELYSSDVGVLNSLIREAKDQKRALESNELMYFIDNPSIGIIDLERAINEFYQRTKRDYVLVIVDLATMMKDFTQTKSGMSTAMVMELAMNRLNEIAKKLRCHFFLVVQFNREGDNLKPESLEDLDFLRPTLNNIKNSAAFAERSRLVISAFRAKYYADRYLKHIEEAEYLNDILEINVLKNSSGPVGDRLEYLYQGDIMKCTPYYKEPDELTTNE